MKKIYIIPQTERNTVFPIEPIQAFSLKNSGQYSNLPATKERGAEFEEIEKKGEEGVTYGNIW